MQRYVFVLCSIVMACSDNNEANDGGTNGDASASTLSDAQIVGVIHTINQGEIQEGQLAMGTAVRADVRQFAQMMITDHTNGDATLVQTASSMGMSPAASDLSLELQSDTASQVGTLQTRTGSSFDDTYIGFQVEDHQNALNTIDTVLAPNARNATVIAQVQAARQMVVMHLAHAQSLESDASTTQ